MKHVTVSCTGCERQLKLPTEVIGGTVRCPLCQTEFLTVGDSHGNVEAVPLASAGAPKPAGPKPLAPILVDEPPPESAGPPSLSIDDVDEVPLAPLAPLAPITPELQPLDDEEDVPRARPAPPPIRKTLPAGKPFAAVRFVVFIQRDPDGRLDGRFQAEVSPDGLRIWRGKGRIIEVPRGSPAEHKKGSRLSVEIEGRMVDLTVIHDRDAIGLAGQVADFLSGEADLVDMPTASAWPFIPFALLPVGVPFLAAAFGDHSAGPLGIALWSCFTAAVVGVALLFVFIKSWSGLARGLLTGLLVFLSYFALAAGLIIDKAMGPGGIPASNWSAFAGPGFSVQMPGRPTSLKRPQAGFADFEEFTLTPPGRDLTYRVLAGRYNDPGNPGDHFVPARRRDDAINTLVTINGTFSTGRNNLPAPAPGIEAAEVSLRGPGTLNGLARVYAGRQRVVVVMATSKSLPANHADITRMVFSANVARMADGGKDGWKDAGIKEVPKDKDAGKMPDTGDLGNGGFRMSAERDQYVWAGFRPDGRIVAVKTRGGHATWDRPGAAPDARPAPGDDEAHAADLHATRLASAGLNGNYLSIVPLDGPHAPLGLADGYRGKALWGVAFSADGKWLATAHGDQKVRIWDAEKRTFEREIASGTNQVLSVAFSPDGGLVAAANADLKIRVHDPKTGALVATCEGHQAVRPPFDGVRDWRWNVRSLSFSRDGRTLVSAGNDETARVWDATTGALIQTIRHPAPVTAAAFHPAGRIIATGSSDGRMRFFDAATGAERGRGIARPAGPYHSIKFNADGGLLVAVRSGQVERWEWMRHAELRAEDTRNVEALPRNVSRLTVPGGSAIQRVEVAAAGSRLAVHTTDNKLHLYAGTPPRPVRIIPLDGPAGEPVFSPDGKRLAHGTRRGTVVFDTDNGEAVATFEHPNEPPPVLAFTPDGARLLMAVQAHPVTRNAYLRVFDLASRVERPPVHGVQARSGMTLSPDGLALATASAFTKPLHLYEAATGREYARLTGHDWGTFRAAWAPDGKTLVSLGQTDGVRIWDAAAGRQRFHVTGDGLAIGRGPGHLSLSPDGKTAAAALHAATSVAVIDLPSGTRLATLKPPGGNVTGLGFGEDGKTLSVAGNGDAIDHYDLAKMPELQKRPAPRPADLEKSPAPEIPDLQPAGTAEPHLAAVIDAEGGHAILFTRDRLALHYAYPSMRLRAAVWAGHVVTQAAFDRKNGRVLAATVGLRSLPANSADVRQGHGPLVSFDVKGLLEGKPPARLEAKELPLTGKFTALAVSGKWLFALDTKEILKPAVRRLDLEKSEAAGNADLPFRPASLALSPDGKKLYAAGQGKPGEGRVARIDPATLKAEKEADAHAWGTSLAATEKYVLVGGFGAAGDGITVLDATKDDLPKLTRWNGLGIPRAWAAGGRIYMMQRLGAVRINAYPAADTLPASAPAVVAQYTGRPPGDDVTLSPDGRHALLLEGTLLRMTSGKIEPPTARWADTAPPAKEAAPIAVLPGAWAAPAGRTLGLAWTPEDRSLIGATSGGEVIRWNAPTGTASRRATPWNVPATGVTLGKFGAHAHVVTAGGDVLSVSVEDMTQTKPTGVRREAVPTGADGIAYGASYLYWADAEGLHGFPNGGGMILAVPSPSPLTGVAAADDAVAAGAFDGIVRVYDIKGKHQRDLKGHEAEVRAVAWSPDGRRLASVDVAGKMILWDGEGKAEKTVEAHASAILALAFAPDGKVIATGAADGSLALWDLTGKKLREVRPRPAMPVCSLAFTSDGQSLAAGEGGELRRYSMLGIVERVKGGGEPAVAARLTATNRGVIIDTGKGFGLALGSTSFGQVTRFTVPAYKTEALFRPDRTIYRLLYDPAGEKVYGFRSATTPVAAPHPRGRNVAVLMFALDKFKGDGKLKGPKGPILAADKQSNVTGTVFCPRLSPDGKHLYWLDADARQVVKFGTGLEGKPETLDLKANPVALALSPDGRTLYAVIEGAVRRGTLVTIDAATMKTTATRPLGQEVYDVAAGADGDVVLAGADKLVWASAATPDRPKRQQLTAGRRYRVETAAAGKLAVLCPDVSGEVELLVWPLDGRGGGRVTVTSAGRAPQGGDFSITPDGSRVALRSGDIVTLPAKWVPK